MVHLRSGEPEPGNPRAVRLDMLFAMRILLVCMLSAFVPTAAADVHQCLDSAGKVLLTDAPCPSGYRLNLTVRAQAAPAPPVPQETASAAAVEPAAIDSRPLDAGAELARLEAENRRLHTALSERRLETLERRLDAFGDRSETYGGFPSPLWITPAVPVCRDGKHCAPRPRLGKPIERPYQGCGTFGCTPTFTHAPWDAQQRHRAAHRVRGTADPSHPSLPRTAVRRGTSVHR